MVKITNWFPLPPPSRTVIPVSDHFYEIRTLSKIIMPTGNNNTCQLTESAVLLNPDSVVCVARPVIKSILWSWPTPWSCLATQVIYKSTWDAIVHGQSLPLPPPFSPLPTPSFPLPCRGEGSFLPSAGPVISSVSENLSVCHSRSLLHGGRYRCTFITLYPV